MSSYINFRSRFAHVQVYSSDTSFRAFEAIKGSNSWARYMVGSSEKIIYGGSAVGGVVNLIDNRIPTQPMEGLNGKADVGWSTVNKESRAAVMLESGNERYGMHVDAFGRHSGDMGEIPWPVRSRVLAPQPRPFVIQPTSAVAMPWVARSFGTKVIWACQARTTTALTARWPRIR